MFQRISFCRCFPFSGLVVCFLCLKRCSGEPEIKIHYHYQFLLRSTVRLFCIGTSTLLEFAYETFYVQHADVNEDSCDRARRAQSLRYSQVIIIAS